MNRRQKAHEIDDSVEHARGKLCPTQVQLWASRGGANDLARPWTLALMGSVELIEAGFAR